MSYNPSNHIPLSKAMGPAGFPLDGKFMYFTNGANGVFKYRPFQSVQEALDYFPLGSIFRGDSNGQPWAFEILINTGGTLSTDGGSIIGGSNNAWWWKDGVADIDLIQKITADVVITASNGVKIVGSDVQADLPYFQSRFVIINPSTTQSGFINVSGDINSGGEIKALQATFGVNGLFLPNGVNINSSKSSLEYLILNQVPTTSTSNYKILTRDDATGEVYCIDAISPHEIIEFTGADGSEINIDLTVNDRQIKFPNPYICAYNTIPVNPTTNKKKLIAGITPEITEVSGLNTNIAIDGIIGDGYFLLTNN